MPRHWQSTKATMDLHLPRQTLVESGFSEGKLYIIKWIQGDLYDIRVGG
jgi:hypothetical protein